MFSLRGMYHKKETKTLISKLEKVSRVHTPKLEGNIKAKNVKKINHPK